MTQDRAKNEKRQRCEVEKAGKVVDQCRSRSSALVFLFFLCAAAGRCQSFNPDAPKPGSEAPTLTFTQVLQLPVGTKADWPSLRGKVVVLEFWATWCAPYIAEIPVLNSLASSLDSDKFVFLAVDDEDPPIVERFLKEKPIEGWIGLGTTGESFKRYGVMARPTTMIVDGTGHMGDDDCPSGTDQARTIGCFSRGQTGHYRRRGGPGTSS